MSTLDAPGGFAQSFIIWLPCLSADDKITGGVLVPLHPSSAQNLSDNVLSLRSMVSARTLLTDKLVAKISRYYFEREDCEVDLQTIYDLMNICEDYKIILEPFKTVIKERVCSKGLVTKRVSKEEYGSYLLGILTTLPWASSLHGVIIMILAANKYYQGLAVLLDILEQYFQDGEKTPLTEKDVLGLIVAIGRLTKEADLERLISILRTEKVIFQDVALLLMGIIVYVGKEEVDKAVKPLFSQIKISHWASLRENVKRMIEYRYLQFLLDGFKAYARQREWKYKIDINSADGREIDKFLRACDIDRKHRMREQILQERAKGPFVDFMDLRSRIPRKTARLMPALSDEFVFGKSGAKIVILASDVVTSVAQGMLSTPTASSPITKFEDLYGREFEFFYSLEPKAYENTLYFSREKRTAVVFSTLLQRNMHGFLPLDEQNNQLLDVLFGSHLAKGKYHIVTLQQGSLFGQGLIINEPILIIKVSDLQELLYSDVGQGIIEYLRQSLMYGSGDEFEAAIQSANFLEALAIDYALDHNKWRIFDAMMDESTQINIFLNPPLKWNIIPQEIDIKEDRGSGESIYRFYMRLPKAPRNTTSSPLEYERKEIKRWLWKSQKGKGGLFYIVVKERQLNPGVSIEIAIEDANDGVKVGRVLLFMNAEGFWHRTDLWVSFDYMLRGLGVKILKVSFQVAAERNIEQFEWNALRLNEASLRTLQRALKGSPYKIASTKVWGPDNEIINFKAGLKRPLTKSAASSPITKFEDLYGREFEFFYSLSPQEYGNILYSRPGKQTTITLSPLLQRSDFGFSPLDKQNRKLLDALFVSQLNQGRYYVATLQLGSLLEPILIIKVGRFKDVSNSDINLRRQIVARLIKIFELSCKARQNPWKAVQSANFLEVSEIGFVLEDYKWDIFENMTDDTPQLNIALDPLKWNIIPQEIDIQEYKGNGGLTYRFYMRLPSEPRSSSPLFNGTVRSWSVISRDLLNMFTDGVRDGIHIPAQEVRELFRLFVNTGFAEGMPGILSQEERNAFFDLLNRKFRIGGTCACISDIPQVKDKIARRRIANFISNLRRADKGMFPVNGFRHDYQYLPAVAVLSSDESVISTVRSMYRFYVDRCFAEKTGAERDILVADKIQGIMQSGLNSDKVVFICEGRLLLEDAMMFSALLYQFYATSMKIGMSRIKNRPYVFVQGKVFLTALRESPRIKIRLLKKIATAKGLSISKIRQPKDRTLYPVSCDRFPNSETMALLKERFISSSPLDSSKSAEQLSLPLFGFEAGVALIKYIYRTKAMEERRTVSGEFAVTDIDSAVEIFKVIELKKGDKFVDLGSGDGRIVFVAALFGAEAVGVEIDDELCGFAEEIKKELSEFMDVTKVSFVRGDIRYFDASEFNVVYWAETETLENIDAIHSVFYDADA
ncbi:MAG: hypothetical protein PHG69_03875, partial [Candidatus Omnitrophica bacterium]|nr:hypothetical protein [Candidatus Omnitrophota bacterium]